MAPSPTAGGKTQWPETEDGEQVTAVSVRLSANIKRNEIARFALGIERKL